MVEKARSGNNESDPVQLPRSEEVAQKVEKTVRLAEQIANLITYEQRKEVLTAVTGYNTLQTAWSLKNKISSFQLYDSEMFGKNYWEHILELNKSMKKGNEMVAASEV